MDKGEKRLSYDDIRNGASLLAIEEAHIVLDKVEELKKDLDTLIETSVAKAIESKMKSQEAILVSTFKKIRKNMKSDIPPPKYFMYTLIFILLVLAFLGGIFFQSLL